MSQDTGVRCTECKEVKSLDAFGASGRRRHFRCKECCQSDRLHVCRVCGEERPSKDFGLLSGYRDKRCRACKRQARREKYHTNPQARAMQIAGSIEQHIKRNFPGQLTGATTKQVAEKLLAVTECHYCGTPNDGWLSFSLDHQVPIALGGLHALSNLVGVCEPCNRAKHDMPLEHFERWLHGVRTRWSRQQEAAD